MAKDKTESAVKVIDAFENAPDYAANYLRTFFMGEPVPDVQVVMSFLAKEFAKLKGMPLLLEIGCGPIVIHTLSAAPRVSGIHMADLREDNLQEIEKWVASAPDAHCWNRYTRFALQAEGAEFNNESVLVREDEARKKISAITLCDLRNPQPLGKFAQYDAVSCFYTTEQASRDRAEWAKVFSNLTGLVAPEGHLFACAVGYTDHYIIYDGSGRAHYYPIPRLTPEDFIKELANNGFDMARTSVTYTPVSGEEDEGVYGVILVSATKKAS